MFSRFATFLGEVKVEFRKVNWPTRRQTLNYTLMVIGVSLVIAVFLGGLDFIFRQILTNFIIR